MKKNQFALHLGLVAVTATTLSVSSFAASSRVQTVEMADTQQLTTEMQVAKQKGPVSPWAAGIEAFFYGPPVNAPGSSWSADDSVGSTTGLMSRTRASVSYTLTKDLILTPVLDFDFQLTDPNDKLGGTQEFHWRDAYVKLAKKNLLKEKFDGNTFTLDGDARAYLPTSKTARVNNTISAFRMSINPSLAFAKSRFSISMTNYAKVWLQSRSTDVRDESRSLNMLELYTGPQVNYMISDHINFFVLYEAQIKWNMAGVNSSTDPNNSLMDIEPGFDFRIHKRVTLSPYLNWYTNQTLDMTSINLLASFSLL